MVTTYVNIKLHLFDVILTLLY